MTDVFNIKAYKEAKIMLPKIDGILRIINLSISGLTIFRAFIPVAVILSTMNEQKVTLEIHRLRYKKIIENKGKRL